MSPGAQTECQCRSIQNCVSKGHEIGKFQVGKGNVQNEFLLHLSGECLSASWPSWYKKTSNIYGFWELLMSEEVYILFEEPWVSGDSGDAVAMREVYTFAMYQNAKIHF